MKRLLLILSLITCAVAIPSGCSTPPADRVTTVQTLETIGASAKAGMDTATQFLKSGTITVAQWQAVATFYDQTFQPAYGLAVIAVQADLSSIASPDILSLSVQFLNLVSQLTSK